MDAWWLDATEPELVGEGTPGALKAAMHPTALGSGARMANAYVLASSQAVYEGQRAADPDRRVFILTRSAFAGSQRYASATWSGDVSADWDSLRKQVPAGLNMALSGIPWWTTDVGGFTVPFFFLFNRGVLMDGGVVQIVQHTAIGALMVVYASLALHGWWGKTPIPWWARLVLGAAALAAIHPNDTIQWPATAIGAALQLLLWKLLEAPAAAAQPTSSPTPPPNTHSHSPNRRTPAPDRGRSCSQTTRCW